MLSINEPGSETASFFQRIGGETHIRELVDAFYDVMDEDPQTDTVRRMHPDDLSGSRTKLYEFLVGWMGGPPLYMNKYGHPRLRMRHLPFEIDEAARDQWMHCMVIAMQRVGLSETLRRDLEKSLYAVADFMRNTQ